MASLAGLGYRQGAIRVAFSLVGIVISALLAWPLTRPVQFLLPYVGIKDPVVTWLLSPFIVFVILLSLFKSGGFFVHRKVDVFYRYKASELQSTLYERLSRRLGLCLGLVNGLIYLILISFVIYDFSYWTTQVATSDEEPKSVRWLNRMGNDLKKTDMVEVARAVDPLPEIYFKAADLAGLLDQNPGLRERLSAYPAFLSLAERDDFKQLGQDTDFQNAWKNTNSPVGLMLNSGIAKSILENNDTRALVWGIVQTNIDDLNSYLQSGQSANMILKKFLAAGTSTSAPPSPCSANPGPTYHPPL